MKTNSTDIRRVHTKITIRDGERKEDVVWGDERTVYITLVEGEVPDQMNNGTWDQRCTLFRPETACLEWQRNTKWGFDGSASGGWRGAVRPATHPHEWVLTRATVKGKNVRKDGSLGVKDTVAIYEGGPYGPGPHHAAEPPQWFADLIEQHDPAKTGSPLDNEPKG
jgi:hypothetical protein